MSDTHKHGLRENSTPQVLPALKHLTQEEQKSLPMELPQGEPKRNCRGLDPRAKPTWEEWRSWDQYRRLLNDQRLRGHDQAFKLWHHYHNCKDGTGRVSGFRAEAWYIARKYGWKLATVYAANALLAKCGFLNWASGQGNSNIVKILHGLGELPGDTGQNELPFIYPSYAHKGTSGQSSSASTGISAVPVQFASSASTGISAVPQEAQPICDSSDNSVRENVTRSAPLENWKILSDLKGIDETADRVRRSPESEEKRALLAGLFEKRRRLTRELAGIPVEAPEPKKSTLAVPVKISPAPDNPGPKLGDPDYQEWKSFVFGASKELPRQ